MSSTDIVKRDYFDPQENADNIEHPHISKITLETKSAVYDFEGDDIPKKTFDAIIVDNARTRVYYAKPMDEGESGAAPDCSSRDGRVPETREGRVNVAAECATCPMNQWGSDIKGGKGKACREKRVLFVIQPGQAFVSKLVLPATSIGSVDRYYSSLLQAKKSFRSVVTRFATIRDDKSPTKYAKAVLTQVADLTPEDKAQMVKNVFPVWERMKAFATGVDSDAARQTPTDAIDSEEVPF